MEKDRSHAGTTTINTTTTTINNNIPYITRDILNERLLKCDEGVIATMTDIHFNALHPENKNVRLKSKKQGTVEVRRNGEWKVAPLKMITETLLERSFGLVVGDAAYVSELFETHPYILNWHANFRSKGAMGKMIEWTHCLLINERVPGG